jgi:hypothetical protein
MHIEYNNKKIYSIYENKNSIAFVSSFSDSIRKRHTYKWVLVTDGKKQVTNRTRFSDR